MIPEEVVGAALAGRPTSEDRGNITPEPAPKSTMTPAIGEFHPAARIFPLMEESALAELAADIAANGLREPIWRHQDGRIIDGCNRWLACQKVGVECRHRTYQHGDDTIVDFVVSRNLHRRHLTTAQRAAIAAELANLERGANQHTIEAPSTAGTSQAQAAKLMDVSVASVERAAAVRRADPELHEKVKAGEITAGKARAEIAKASAVNPPVPEPWPEPGPADDLEQDHGDDAEPNDGDRALAAIMAVAKLKISGTAAAKRYEWTEAELVQADKASRWLRMFIQVAARERHRRRFAR